LECFAVEENCIEDLKMYFKKHLSESDEEWSQHKAIYDTTQKKGFIQKIIPQNFPYFHVDFEAAGGFAHVIENEAKFDLNLAREIIGGYFEIDESHIKYPKELPQHKSEAQIAELLKQFPLYDWTIYN
jgi:hypothetical protein